MKPGVYMGVVLRFPCPGCRRWVPFERTRIPCADHFHEHAVCPFCAYTFPYAYLMRAIESLRWDWTGPVSLSHN